VKTFGLALLAIFLTTNAWAANKPAGSPVAAPLAQPAEPSTPSPLIVTMSQELDREMPILSKANPPAYFVSYILTSTDRSEVVGSNGALLSSEESHSRWLETQVRVGSYDLDNTHKVGNSGPGQGSLGTAVPVDDAPDVLRRAMWQETDKQFRAASESLSKSVPARKFRYRRTRNMRRILPAKNRTRSMARKFPSILTANPGKQKFACTRRRFVLPRRFSIPS
jgi:hypothetical protein